MKFRIEIELDELEIVNQIRLKVFKYLENENIPKRATIKTFEDGKPILNNAEIRRR